jgi:V/A-type H+-transporting ATPase subunit I
MFLPERMQQINVLVLESELDDVVRAIVRLGILHLIRLDDQEPWAENLRSYEAGGARAKIDFLRNRLANLTKDLGIDQLTIEPGGSIPEISMGDLGEIEKYLATLQLSIEGTIARRSDVTKKLERLEAIASEVSPLLSLGVPIERSMYTFLDVHYGEVRSENVPYIREKLAPLAAVFLPVGRREKSELVLLIGLKSDRLKIKRILSEASFEEIEISEAVRKEAPQVSGELAKRIDDLKEDLAAVNRDVAAIRDENLSKITEYNRSLMIAALLMRFKNYLKRTKKTYILSGWIPSKERRVIERDIMEAAKGRAIIEVHSPEELPAVKSGRVKVPVLLKHPRFFKPFEMLLSSYGLPDYKVIDPTLVMAITFLLMFGVMFGDVGHGVVLVLIGALLSRRAKAPASTMALFGKLAMYCGTSSIVFGFLFGSIFGFEHLIPHVWMKPMNNIMYFFKVAIYYGIAVITLGIAFNLINTIRARKFTAVVFDHAGLLAAIMYWAGIIAISYMLSNRPIPGKLLLIAIGVPLILIFFKEPIIDIVNRRKVHFEQGFGMYLFESLIEVMEIVMGYLANTVSFIRVAAFSLAHVGLFIAVFSLADMVSGASGGVVYSVLIHIFGNVGIIALEGLIVTIQAIRLEYYEFFGKFFFGGGVAYKPISLGLQPGREE